MKLRYAEMHNGVIVHTAIGESDDDMSAQDSAEALANMRKDYLVDAVLVWLDPTASVTTPPDGRALQRARCGF